MEFFTLIAAFISSVLELAVAFILTFISCMVVKFQVVP
jgi:hypothetical protein